MAKYNIEQQENEAWRECKVLGSLLSTEKDINRKKILAVSACKTFNSIFRNKKNSFKIKLRTFNAYEQVYFWIMAKLDPNKAARKHHRHLPT